MDDFRQCKICKKLKCINSFQTSHSGYKIWTCNQCKDKGRNPDLLANRVQKRLSKIKEQRKLGLEISKFILEDSRNYDRKRNLENDLTKEYIDQEISKGCCYCGETSIRISLDRIDNTIGHIKSNVLPACIRCNLVRRDMPHKAWLVIAKGMREARELGLFGEYTGTIKVYEKQSNGLW